MKTIYALFLLPFIMLTQNLSAEEYVRLNALSPFYCNYLDNGKTLLAIKSKSGKFIKISFDKGRELSGDRKAEYRLKQKKINALKKKLIAEIQRIEYSPRELTEKEKKQILDFADGSTETPNVPIDSPIDAVTILEQISRNLQTSLEFQNLERNQIKDCERKVLPPFGTLTINYDLLIAQDLSSQSPRWVGLGIAYVKMDSFLLTTGENANAVCMTYVNGIKRYVAFSSDPMGVTDDLLRYGTDHPLVIYGETARLLARDSENRVTEYGFVIDDFADGVSSNSREGIENRYKSALPAVIQKYGNTVDAVRPKYNKQSKTYSCP